MILHELSAGISCQKSYTVNIRFLNLCFIGLSACRLIFLSLYLHPASLKKLLQRGVSFMTSSRVTLWGQPTPKLFPGTISGTFPFQPKLSRSRPAAYAAATSCPGFAWGGSRPWQEHGAQSRGETVRSYLTLSRCSGWHWRTQLPRYGDEPSGLCPWTYCQDWRRGFRYTDHLFSFHSYF